MNVVTILGIVIQVSLFLVVMSYGMQATRDDFLYLFRRPVQLLKALLSIYVIMPVFAVTLTRVFELNPVLEVALIALAVAPVPPLMPRKTLKAGVEKQFTFGILAAITLASIVVIPVVFKIVDTLFRERTTVDSYAILRTVFINVVLPIILGLLIRYFAPAFADRVGATLGKVGMIALLVAFLPILLAIIPTMWALIGNGTIIALVVFTLVGVTIGHLLGGPDPNERRVLALATASRHPGISIILVSTNVGENETRLAAAAVLLYLIVSGIVLTPYLRWLSGPKEKNKDTQETDRHSV